MPNFLFVRMWLRSHASILLKLAKGLRERQARPLNEKPNDLMLFRNSVFLTT